MYNLCTQSTYSFYYVLAKPTYTLIQAAAISPALHGVWAERASLYDTVKVLS